MECIKAGSTLRDFQSLRLAVEYVEKTDHAALSDKSILGERLVKQGAY